MRKVEILAPVGNIDVLPAAISAGANAVYLAGKSFGARAFALNFTNDEMINAIKLCHLYNVLVYVTINTVIFESEIDEVIKYIDFLYLNDVDAVIIQDLGLASIIKHRYPNLQMHASTQVNAQTYEDCKVLHSLGFSRVILGREVSLDKIKEIKNKIKEDNINLEIEAFVQGSLCISYSGGCFYSKLLGGRSGNRGKCAQPCRKLHLFNGKERYYLSPKDLMTVNKLDEITDYVDSLKIEGRMKSKEYVYYSVLSIYNAINKKMYEDNIKNLKIAFNRGFTKGFILNAKNDEITNVDISNHQGLYIGKIISKDLNNKEKVNIKLESDIKIKDSIRIVSNNLDNKNKQNEDAVIINQMYVKGNLVKTAKANDVISIRLHKQMNVGDLIYLTKREENFSLPKIEINGSVYIKNNKFILDINDKENRIIKEINYEYSEKLLENRIKEQINKTGSTPFVFKTLEVNAQNCYVAIKELNDIRRLALDELVSIREKKNFKRAINLKELYININDENKIINEFNKYSICVSDNKQLNKILKVNSLDYDIYYRNNLEIKNGKSYKYLPRVTDEVAYESVSTNIGNMNFISSVYANVTNSYTVRVLESLGVRKIGLSIEMSKENICDLVNAYKSKYKSIPNLEVMVYGYYQMIYMKHCFINKEYRYKNIHCNKCKEKIYFDNDYRVFGDENCHLAILYNKPINLTKEILQLEKIGIKHFLFDYTIEDENDIIELESYKDLIDDYYGCYK